MDKNLYDLDPIELSNIPKMPASLDEALDELEKDYEFLLKGDCFYRGSCIYLDRLQEK